MENRLLRLLNSNQVLNEHIDDYKEAFIEFYGEDMRELIEEQFSKCTFIAQLPPKSIGTTISSLYEAKSIELVNKAIEESGLKFTYDDLIGKYSSLRSFNLSPIYMFHEFYEQHKLGIQGRKDAYLRARYNELLENNPNMSYNDFLVNYPFIVNDERFQDKYNSLYSRISPLLRKISPELDYDNINQVMGKEIYQKLDELFYIVNSKMEEFNQYEEELASYEKLDDSLDKLAIVKANNGILDLARDTYHLFPNQLKNNLDSILNGTTPSYARGELFDFIYGRDIRYPSSFQCFSEQSDQDLASNKEEWKTDSIKKNRIKYFNLMGIDLGNDYDSYINDERVRSIIPTKEVCSEFFSARDKYLNKFNNDFFNSIPSNIAIREQIDSLGLLVDDDAFNASSYNYAAFINPNVTMTDDGLDMHTILIVNCNQYNYHLDHYVTHELNHLIELSLVGETDTAYNFLCGWDSVEVEKTRDGENKEVDTLSKREDKREYELFNEIINEKLAQEVSTIMHSHDKHMFNDRDSAKIKNASSYEHYSFLVNDFYNSYKDDIIRSRHNGNIGIIYDAVGRDNFDKLNLLCNEFGESFPGFSFYDLCRDLSEKKSTERTDKFYELNRKKDAIMMSIDLYRQSKGYKTVEKQVSK